MESEESSKEVAKKLEELKDAGCLPDDISLPEFPSCEDTNGGMFEKFHCIAKR